MILPSQTATLQSLQTSLSYLSPPVENISAENIADRKLHEHSAKANIKVLQTSNELQGQLVDMVV